jgi:hypothetical protein
VRFIILRGKMVEASSISWAGARPAPTGTEAALYVNLVQKHERTRERVGTQANKQGMCYNFVHTFSS